jgi:hypothetical protein
MEREAQRGHETARLGPNSAERPEVVIDNIEVEARFVELVRRGETMGGEHV